ncbi:MAG: hypothetical protein GF320_13820 [Armatimonadia bacterium]|nr:hypothetical protein [Armatimonadia bacterium]
MNPYAIGAAALLLILAGAAHAGSAQILRDEYGVPHIYAGTDTEAAYALGYAQAEDRLQQILWNYRYAFGTLAEAFGESHLETDRIQRLMGHRHHSRSQYESIDPEVRTLIEAFQDGVRRYMEEHPDEVPEWAPEIEPAMAVALGRSIVFQWPVGTGFDELGRADRDFQFASNEWALSPGNTMEGHALLCIDPHIGWDGPMRFYEYRLHGDSLNVSGFGVVGGPTLGLGHNDHHGWAATTGGPDTADIFVVQLDPENDGHYLLDGESKPADLRVETIHVAGGEPVELPVFHTEHGVVIERDDERGVAYAFATPYLDQVGLVEQLHRMSVARSLDEFKEAVGMLQLMEQNLMYADVEGNIYYIRNGRVPIRPEGIDYSQPVPGNTSDTLWLGIHEMADLIQVENPPTGYMQNCNISPEYLARRPLVDPTEWPEYLFNTTWDTMNSRGAKALQRLDVRHKIGLTEAMDIVLDIEPFRAAEWGHLTITAAEQRPDHPALPALTDALEIIDGWRGALTPDARGPALLAMQWRHLEGAKELWQGWAFGGYELTADDYDALLAALAVGIEEMAEHGLGADAEWGDLFVVARGEHSTPAMGGEIGDIECLRVIGFDWDEDRQKFVGDRGSSWTQLVQLDPAGVHSWTATPWGQSDDPQSPHFFDQAALFCEPALKPSWFHRDDLEGHVNSSTELEF